MLFKKTLSSLGPKAPLILHLLIALVTRTGVNVVTVSIDSRLSSLDTIVLYCMFGPCAKAVLPLAHRHSQVGAESHIQLLTDCGVF